MTMEIKTVNVDVKKLWMSQKEALKYLGVSKDWLKERRLDGTFHYAIIGKTTFYIKSEIDNLIKKNAVTGVEHFRLTAR